MSGEILDVAVGKMLAAFGVRVSEERVEPFTDAVRDAEQCEPCAARAARNLMANMKRCPFPVHLVEETMQVTGTSEHLRHVQDRTALSTGDMGVWWVTEAPVIIRANWPELTHEQAIKVGKAMGEMGYVEPEWSSIGAELGFVDSIGATEERKWWYRYMPELVPSGADDVSQRQMPVGDR